MSCFRTRNSPAWGPVRVTDKDFVCGDSSNEFVSCCERGHVCTESQICMSGSRYYTSACTDPNFLDPACNRACVKYWVPDITFDTDRGLWLCCGTANNSDTGTEATCESPTNTFFPGPSPEELAAGLLVSLSSSLVSVSTGTPTSTSPVIMTTTLTPEQPVREVAQSTLSTGAKAGIGVGAGVGAILLLSMLFWISTQFRLTRKVSPSRGEENATPSLFPKPELAAPASGRKSLENPEAFTELPTNGMPHVRELPIDDRE